MTFYVYLNTQDAPIAWAVARGVLVSCETMREQGFVSFMMAGMIRHQANRRLYNEAIIESIRASKFPKNTVSRLRGLYLFDDREIALGLAGDDNWPPHFSEENLYEVVLHESKGICRLDSDWITYAPLDNDGLLDLGQLGWIERYWAGEPRSDNPTWEVLLAGSVALTDGEKRKAVYKSLIQAYPNAELYLAMSRVAAESGLDGGLSMPFIVADDAGFLRLDFFADDRPFHDQASIKRMSTHPDFPYMLSLFESGKPWTLPDFSPFGATYTIGQSIVDALERIQVPTLHHT